MVQLCGAKIRITARRLAKAEAIGPEAVAALLRRNTCRNHPVPGRTRCRLHGGWSTGPRDKSKLPLAWAAQQLRWKSEPWRVGVKKNSHHSGKTAAKRKRNEEIRRLVAERHRQSNLSGELTAEVQE
jgi:hypothetical protein